MKHIIPLLLGATLVGCAGQAPNPTQPVLISEEPKPEWVTEHKLEDSTTMYFTGISTKYAEERKALKDAKYDALSRFLDYCGLHTKLHEKYISHVNGSTANVLATTNKIETQLETNSEAQVGQFRVIKKHMEVYNGTRGKFYKMYILASVPKNEVGRVKAWQKENDLQKIAKLKSLTEQQSNLINETKQELETVQTELESALVLIKRKDFLEQEVVKLQEELDNKNIKLTSLENEHNNQQETLDWYEEKDLLQSKTIDSLQEKIELLQLDLKIAKDGEDHWMKKFNDKKTISLFTWK
tara:strand:+ start:915 stop:1805 length:891 start_codon:yes stop_codon:yes gene_type:complete